MALSIAQIKFWHTDYGLSHSISLQCKGVFLTTTAICAKLSVFPMLVCVPEYFIGETCQFRRQKLS